MDAAFVRLVASPAANVVSKGGVSDPAFAAVEEVATLDFLGSRPDVARIRTGLRLSQGPS